MNKKLILIVLTLSLLVLTSFSVSAKNFPESTSISATLQNDSCEINPHADIIEWRYKTIDGKLFKRQFNCTTGKWIGNWQPC